MEYFDKEDVYDDEISPLMNKIIGICKKHNIPMIASFAYENCQDNGIGCCTTLLNEEGDRHVDNFQSALHEIRKPVAVTSSAIITIK